MIAKFIIVISVFYYCLYNRYYYTENLLGVLFLSGLIAYSFTQVNKILGLFIAYVLIHTSYILFSYPSKFLVLGVNWSNYINYIISNSLVWFLLFIIAIFVISNDLFKKIFSIISYICITNAFVSLCYIFSKWYTDGSIEFRGMIGVSSIDAALTACCIPIFWEQWKDKNKYLRYALLIMIITSVIFLKGSVGLGCLIISLMFMGRRISKKNIKIILPWVSIILAIALYVFEDSLLLSAGRFDIYRDSFDYWFKLENIWVGTGIGTFWFYGPLIQQAYHWTRPDYFTHMHSDILQFLFEFGFIGLGILLVLIIDFFWKVRNRPYLVAAGMSYLCFASLYYPVHEFTTALVGILIYREALYGN